MEDATKLLPLVKAIARDIHRAIPKYVELDDLMGAGQVGAVQASSHYSSKVGTTLEQFAKRRIRGAILDYLRKLDPLGR